MRNTQKIFIKGNVYIFKKGYDDEMHILCTKTTCSHTSKTFEGVVVKAKQSSNAIVGSISDHWLTTFSDLSLHDAPSDELLLDMTKL